MDPPASAQEKDVERARDTLFRQVFDEHAAYIHASLARLGIRDADRDDLSSEVFVRVHRELDRYDRARPLRPWLFAFAARVASDHRRLARHRREVFEEPADVASDAPAPDRALESLEARRTVERALGELDLDKRAVFVLHDLDETPVPEIARALEIAEGTAYSRLVGRPRSRSTQPP
jgi:RNA polymerase sigma-70 factor (ECF subfamily)